MSGGRRGIRHVLERLHRPAAVKRGERGAEAASSPRRRVEVQEQRALADRTRGLEQLLGAARARCQLKTVAAEIIGAAATPDFRTLTIDKGTPRRPQAPTWR